MVREEARRRLLREYDKWANAHPADATKSSGVVFFTYLQKERTDLLDFHAIGGDKWATVHGWLYYTGRVKDEANVRFADSIALHADRSVESGGRVSASRPLRLKTC
jgi:hypothetical protein